jgi:Family of unknown function (DUF6492)
VIDLVTVVFDQELNTLRTQARSIAVYGKNIGTIFVVINDTVDLSSQIDRSWWGIWQDHVQIINRQVFGCKWSDNGWVSQQVLKLMTATISCNQWSIILDAKTFFVRSMPEFDNRPAVGRRDIYPVFYPSRDIINRLFDIDLCEQLGPGGVPFVINTQATRTMIEWIEQHIRQDFVTWFQEQGRLTEFLLYSGWLYRQGGFDKWYIVTHSDLTPCNLCHSEPGCFDDKFVKMQSSHTVSIHRHAWPQLTAEQQTKYIEFLKSRGIE